LDVVSLSAARNLLNVSLQGRHLIQHIEKLLLLSVQLVLLHTLHQLLVDCLKRVLVWIQLGLLLNSVGRFVIQLGFH